MRPWTAWIGLALLTQPACSLLFDPSTYEGDGGLDSGGFDASSDEDAPRPDAWLDPTVDANADAPAIDAQPTDAPVSPCPSTLDRLPTCADPASTTYCEDGSETVVTVPMSAFDLGLPGGGAATFRAGVLPAPANLVDLAPGAASQRRFAMSRVGNELYFGFIRTDDAWLAHAAFDDALGTIAATQVVAPVDAFNPEIAIRGDQAWLLGNREAWGPVTIPATPFPSPTRVAPANGHITYAGDSPVLLAGAMLVEPVGPAVPAMGFSHFRGAPFLVYSEFSSTVNGAVFLPAGPAGATILDAGTVRIRHLAGDSMESVYAVTDTSELASTGNVRIRQLTCRAGDGCSFMGAPTLVSVGAERQQVLDLHYEELDTSTTPPRLLVLAYRESGASITHIDALLWRGAPLEVVELPIATLDGDIYQMQVETRRDLVGGGDVRFDVLVGYHAPGNRELDRAQLSALRLLGCE
jgi:hypothetical protein